MNANGILRQHWHHVAVHFIIDAVAFITAFLLCAYVVEEPMLVQGKIIAYLPGIVLGSLAFPCMVYIFGLYSPLSYKQKVLSRAVILAMCLAGTAFIMMGMYYINRSTVIGRGVRADASKKIVRQNDPCTFEKCV